MADEIKQKLSFDVTEFKAGIADMNRGIRIARNEFTAAAGALGDWRKSYEGIETRIKSLNDVMELQRAKVDALTKEYDDLKSTGTASEGALKRLQEQISKANADLGKTEGQLKEATDAQDKFGKETDDTSDELVRYGKETDDAGKKTGRFSEFLKKAGSVMKSGIVASAKAVATSMAAIGAAAGAAAVGVFNLAKKSGEWADDLKTTSDQTGLTVQQLQELQYTSRFVDVEVETMTKSMAKNIKSMKGVQDGTKLSVEAYKKLGVQVLNTDGSMRDGQDVYWEVIDALGAMENETERDALGMQILGKSAQELNPMIKAGSEAMKSYAAEARELGLVMSDEMVNKLGDFDDLMQKTNAQFEGIGRQLAITFLPGIQAAGTAVSGLLSKISDALSDGFQPEDIKAIGAELSEMLLDGMKTISTYIPQLVDVISTTLTEAIRIVVELLPKLLPILLDGALQLIQGLLDAIKANVQPLMDTVVAMLTAFAEFVLMNLPMIIELGLQMVIALAQGLVDAIPTLIPAIIGAVIQIVDTIMANLPLIIEVAIQIILALVRGLVAALPQLIAWLPEIIDTIVDVLINSLPLLIDAAIQIIIALVGGMINALPQLVAAGPQIIGAIVKGIIGSVGQMVQAVPTLFKALWDKFKSMDWIQVGMDIIGGIANGIGNAVGTLIDAARNAARSALDTIKKFLGIASPSKVFQDEVGVNMGLGVAEGISKTSTDISDAMKGVTDKLKGDVQIDKTINVAGVATQASGGSAILQIENFYNNTDKDIEQLAYEFEFARQKAAVALGG